MVARTAIFLAVLTLAVTSAPASAHPGSGIVVDRAGNVYFVRSGQSVVWRLSPNGRVTKFVDDDIVRLPHHLLIGRDGALYFASDFDGRIWRADSAGHLTEHFNTNRIVGNPSIFVGQWGDPWTLDADGNVYALASQNGTSLVHITPGGIVTPVARRARFGDLHAASMTIGADGALYLTDATRVWRIVGDSAVALGGAPLAYGAGIAVAADGSVYAADQRARRIVRLSRDGTVSTPPQLADLTLSYPWGVTVAPDGAVYVLDHLSNGQGVAIWRVEGELATRVYVARGVSMFIPVLVLTLVPLLFVLQTMARRPSSRTDWVLWILVTGLIVGAAWWVGGSVWIFSWLRHALMASFVYAAWVSWRRLAPSIPAQA